MITLNGYNHKYINSKGEKVPGVTTVLGVSAKPYLIPWANKLGLDGINLAEYNKEISGIGTLTHAYIEGFLKHEEVDDSSMPDSIKEGAKVCFDKFKKWHELHDIEVLATELSLSGERFGGTIDAILRIDGSVFLMDWKTSKSIYPEYWSQLSAYLKLLNDNKYEPEIEGLAILQIPKESSNFQFEVVERNCSKIEDAYMYFEACLNLYEVKKRTRMQRNFIVNF
jgi:hypothetical protein